MNNSRIPEGSEFATHCETVYYKHSYFGGNAGNLEKKLLIYDNSKKVWIESNYHIEELKVNRVTTHRLVQFRYDGEDEFLIQTYMTDGQLNELYELYSSEWGEVHDIKGNISFRDWFDNIFEERVYIDSFIEL